MGSIVNIIRAMVLAVIQHHSMLTLLIISAKDSNVIGSKHCSFTFASPLTIVAHSRMPGKRKRSWF